MQIKITKDLICIAPSYQPVKGKIYEVEEMTSALDNQCKHNGYVIKVNGHRVMVMENEFEIVEEQEEHNE